MEEIERVSTPQNEQTPDNSSHKRVAVVLLFLIVLAMLSYAVFYEIAVMPKNKVAENIARHDNAYYASLLQNNPSLIQNSLVDDLKSGINDKYTKSDAYFVTHRYFDNGGNIYEIYNYVNSHPELAFLKEAETMYPGIFEQIKNKTVPPTFVDRSLYAYLAYVEVLYKHGYTDIAAIGTVANQYAKLAYFNATIAKKMTEKEAVIKAKNVPRDTKKARQFIKLSKSDVTKILDGKITSNDVTPRDILVGLNQYAAALRYLKALGINATSTKTPDEIFAFTMDYSHRYVPELNLFTSLLNASTLVILSSSTPAEVRAALYPILDLDTKNMKLLSTSIVHKIIDSRFEKKPTNIGDLDLDIYSKTNIQMLSKKVPEFKQWLMSNGWTKEDFE